MRSELAPRPRRPDLGTEIDEQSLRIEQSIPRRTFVLSPAKRHPVEQLCACTLESLSSIEVACDGSLVLRQRLLDVIAHLSSQ